jgi:uncharacterized protein
LTSPLPPTASWTRRIGDAVRARLPSRDELARWPLLGRIADRLGARELWRPRPEGLARGAAVGVFWAFATPGAQIALAAAHCVWWRAHIPVAAAATLITNPLTIGAWLLLAHELGSWILGGNGAPPLPIDAGWLTQAQALGWPTAVGMATFAVGGAALAYVLVRVGAQAWLAWRLRRRAVRRAA